MNDPVLSVLASRQSMADEGYSRSLAISAVVHGCLFFATLVMALLMPPRRIINVIDGFAVPLPRGGGLPRLTEPAPDPASISPDDAATAALKAPAPIKLIKPESEVVRKGLAPEELRRSLKEPRKAESREIATQRVGASEPSRAATASTPGLAMAATGLDFTAQTPGVLNGAPGPAGPLGFYLAAAQNRIWATWARQIRPDLAGNVKVAFTIHRDGSVDLVEIVESSGSATIDRLAERAIVSTQLGPLPNSYEKETLVVHANFKPVS